MNSVSTSRKIANAARPLLDKEGTEAVTLRRVAKAVGITPMAIYRHFKDRAGLLNFLADEGFEELTARLAAKRLSGDTEKRLTKLGEIHLEYALQHPRLYELMFLKPRGGARRYPQDFRAGRSPTTNPTVELIREGMESGYLRKDDACAVEALIAEGININITLVFSLAHYEAVAQAYLRGLKRNAKPHQVSSVASFFVSRVDTEVDRALEGIGTPEALSLHGKIAIANAKVVYQRFREIFLGTAVEEFRRREARLQRPLWASYRNQEPSFLGCFIRRGVNRTTHHQHHSTRDPECIP
jgi:AcrR family transcriptional regulator